MATLIDVLSLPGRGNSQRTGCLMNQWIWITPFSTVDPRSPGVVSPMIDHDILLYDILNFSKGGRVL